MSQPIVTQVPLTVEELAERSDVGRLLVRRGVGAGIDFTVLFLLLLVPEAILGIDRYHDTLRVWIGLQIRISSNNATIFRATCPRRSRKST